ncbi:MAG: Flp pilus assembly complex ATPase component TadA [Burkholderiaceae bacterium]|nr:Flp pilus assembly complex ATPase component TadA [Burkholderiaceae bacterium]
MLEVMIEEDGKPLRTVTVERFPCRIGKARDAEVALAGWRVGRVHAEIHRVGRSLKLVDLGTLGGTLVNGDRVVEYGPLSERDQIAIAGYRLRVYGDALRLPPGSRHATMMSGPALQPTTAESIGHPPAGGQAGSGAGSDRDGAATRAAQAAEPSPVPERLAALPWRRLVHRRLLEQIDLRRSNLSQFSPEQLRAEVQQAVEGIVADLEALPAGIDRGALVRDTLDEAIGLGPLEPLMADGDVTEIMVNGAVDVFVERHGRLERVDAAFSDDVAIRNVIDRIVAPLGRRIDEASPLVDARLPDGSRVNAIIPPVALKGPTLTIRRFNRAVLSPQSLVALGSATMAMMAFFGICVQERKSIVVSGGTGSGKTTLLNVLSNLIPESERLVTIEDAAELKLRHEHLVSLEARPPNAEGRGAVTIRDLVRNALRMRPDRIIVGECRGAEALDMLQAMNTGHEGSLTTLHANTPRDALSRLEVMTLMAGVDLPVAAIREQIASAVDLIIHQSRFRDGTRRITSVTEVTGIESGRVQTQELFRFAQSSSGVVSIRGCHVAAGAVPAFYEDLAARGVVLDFGIFREDAGAGA